MRSPLASPFRGGWRNLTPMRGRGRGGANPWTPAMLSPYAWYDAELGQPKNVGYVELSGVSGDYISTPDSAALSFSNDIEVVMRVRVTDWSTGSGQTLCGKYVSTGNQRSWRFYVSSTGSIGLSVSQDGTSSVTTVTVTPTVALADDAWVWLRVRLDLSNGTNSVGTLETAADTGDNVEPASWTANGTNTGTTIATVFDSTAALEIGAFAAGTLERLAGSVGRCIVRSGFGGTTVADFNADDCYGDGYTHTDGYRWTLGLPKIYDRSGNNHPPAVFGAGSNQPLWLPWDGTPSVYLPGVTGNYVSCPDAAPLDITGDMEIVARVTVTAWGTGAYQGLVAKFDGPSGSGRSYLLRAHPARRLEFSWYDSGTLTVRSVTTDVLTALVDGVTHWVKVEFDADNGAGGCVTRFFLAADQPAEPSSWTLIGDVTTAGVASIGVGSFPLVLGTDSAATRALNGAIYRAIVRNGIAGTTVADFDASLCGQSGHTDSVGNVWTVNRSTTGRKTVVQSHVANSARSVILLGTDDYIDVPAAAIPNVDADFTISLVTRLWGSPAFSRLFSTQNTTSSSGAGVYWMILSGSTTYEARLADGTNLVASGGHNLRAGLREVLSLLTSGATMTTRQSNVDQLGPSSTAAVGSRITAAARVAASTNGAGVSDQEFSALFTRDATESVTEHGLATAYYRGGL